MQSEEIALIAACFCVPMGTSEFVPITTHVVVVGTHVLRQMRSANLMYQIKCLACLGTISGYKVKCGEKIGSDS